MHLFILESDVANDVEVGNHTVLGKFVSMYEETYAFIFNINDALEEVAYLI